MPEPSDVSDTRHAYDFVAIDYAHRLQPKLARKPMDRAVSSRGTPSFTARLDPERITARLDVTGLAVTNRLIRAPDESEQTPQAFLVARKH